jgi:tRNA-2-methylthio-N6-dimethylallyladenosine synthase
MPRVSLSGDVVVGFPGESEADFAATLALVEAARFSQLFGFAYSPRPRTPAARYDGRVDRAVAGARLERLFALQSAIQLEANQLLIGSTVEVLVDGPAKRGGAQWQGRGDDNRVVNFAAGDGTREGTLLDIVITGATPHALLGEVASSRQRRNTVAA